MLKKILLSLFCVSFAFHLESSVIEYSRSVEDVPINFSSGFYVPKFDPQLGTLDKIEFALTGSFTGASRTENLSMSSATITLNNRVNFTQSVNFGPTLFNEYVNRQDVFNALSWDGGFPPDWTGTSGKEFVFGTEIFNTFFLEKDDMSSLSLFTNFSKESPVIHVGDEF